jgi:hypothetical protein
MGQEFLHFTRLYRSPFNGLSLRVLSSRFLPSKGTILTLLIFKSPTPIRLTQMPSGLEGRN